MSYGRRIVRFGASLFTVSLLGGLAACSSGLNAVVETVQEAVRPDTSTSGVQLDPRFKYLRVTVAGRPSFLALGNEERLPDGVMQVWYSAKKEVLKFQNGRLVGAAGVTTEWGNVRLLNAPRWGGIPHDQQVEWRRVRDVAPGYRYGVEDRLSIKRIDTPKRSELQRLDAAKLAWFEERQASNVADMGLPVARYAVDLSGGREEVVYGEQCLSKELCFTWQKWPVNDKK